MSNNSTQRFSNRVEDYIKYRPHYPSAIIDYLQQHYHISKDFVIADIGAGTGISSALFLNAGYAVIAVEPNLEMREKSVALLGDNPLFQAMDGTAENTGLGAKSIDVIVAGQAYHWFDVSKAKVEFQRILKPQGIVVLIWNERMATSPFEQAYDQLILKHARDYMQVQHRNIDAEDIAAFFAPAPMDMKVFDNYQSFDFKGLKGRLSSSSYMPAKGEDGYDAMITDLKKLFDQYQEDDKIRINYETKVYSGHLK